VTTLLGLKTEKKNFHFPGFWAETEKYLSDFARRKKLKNIFPIPVGNVKIFENRVIFLPFFRRINVNFPRIFSSQDYLKKFVQNLDFVSKRKLVLNDQEFFALQDV